MRSIKAFFRDIVYGNSVTLAIRVAMGLLILFSGALKVFDPVSFSIVIDRYGILPGPLVPYAAVVLPVVEVAVGFFLVAGFRIKASALISGVLMLVFSLAIGMNIARGEIFDCGCFDFGRLGISLDEGIGPRVLARDIGMMLFSVMIYRAEKHVLSIEGLMDRRDLENL
ncbi:MAG: DoxX family membrane protein [Spirochaetes bacterium]|jgi:uncharacterized membrane protein YphA (DoxX/SURF4 family)|nr:DoxX family membrane protein [Spirochaetota bacterium]